MREEDRLTPDLVFRDPYFLDFLGLRVAQYLTDLPPCELLERKLHDAILVARERLDRQLLK